MDYYGGKIVFVVMLSTAFSVFGIAVFEILLKAAGFAYAHADSVPEIAVVVRVAAACPLDVWNAGRDGNLVDAE